ncbi:hypothetical protein [Chondromyces crocatus]|uniref:Uncharacterized protein n=1 Tax=Chondromyces crocatus TaxID=52 RepID=A0A0K1EFW3_CHOCO|nr:hypothetical protein [Chondromyces crocatus]AKT39562.1 uncharacterized protein CMC5_037090 [Chondromyces crocatus]
MRSWVDRALQAVAAVSRGGVGAAVASLAPRGASVAAQWLLALSAGPAAAALFVTCTSRGAAVVAMIGAGMAPVIAGRPRLLSTRRGRALLASAIAWLAGAAFLVSLAVEAVTGASGGSGLAAALFAGSVVFYNCAPAAWPIWQSRGRFPAVLGGSLLVTPVASSLVALAGAPRLTAVLVGFGGAFPVVTMLSGARATRSFRLALWLARRALPLSLLSMATAVVYPVALTQGIAWMGASVVGVQTLYWSLALVANIASQSLAARAVITAGGGTSEALRRWLAAVGMLLLLLAVAFVVFRARAGEGVLPRFVLLGAAIFLVTDGLAFYFAPPTARPVLVGVTSVGAVLVGLGVWWRPTVLQSISVVGPSAIIALLRLVPMLAFSRVRVVAALSLIVLLAGAVLALGFP